MERAIIWLLLLFLYFFLVNSEVEQVSLIYPKGLKGGGKAVDYLDFYYDSLKFLSNYTSGIIPSSCYTDPNIVALIFYTIYIETKNRYWVSGINIPDYTFGQIQLREMATVRCRYYHDKAGKEIVRLPREDEVGGDFNAIYALADIRLYWKSRMEKYLSSYKMRLPISSRTAAGMWKKYYNTPAGQGVASKAYQQSVRFEKQVNEWIMRKYIQLNKLKPGKEYSYDTLEFTKSGTKLISTQRKSNDSWVNFSGCDISTPLNSNEIYAERMY